MILFLYGEDTYRSQRQLEEIRAKFLKDVDASGLNLIELEAGKSDIGEAAAALTASAFLANRRLVILKGFLQASKRKPTIHKEWAALYDRVPDDTIAVIHEQLSGESFGKSAAFGRLKKEKFYPEFAPLSPRQMTGWIKQEAKARSLEFSRDGLQAYARTAGTDLWKVAAELDKFAAYGRSTKKPVDAETVSQLSDYSTEESIFEFLDMIGARNMSRAAEIFNGLLEQGESEIMLVSRLQSHFRSLLVCADLARTEKVKKDRLVRELGIHPFVATKVISQSRYFDRDELVEIYGWLIEADKKLKVGGWPKPRMAIDMLLMKLAGEKAK